MKMLLGPMLVNTSLTPSQGKGIHLGLGGYLLSARGVKLVFTSFGPNNVTVSQLFHCIEMIKMSFV